MKIITDSITISASQQQVWNTFTNDNSYKKWSAIFQKGSFFRGGWEKGEAINFLCFNKKGFEEGMVAEIAESTFPSYISVRLLGYMIDGNEDTSSEDILSWAPAYENYSFKKNDGKTTSFEIEVEVLDEYYEAFNTMWPKALLLIKEIAEKSNI